MFFFWLVLNERFAFCVIAVKVAYYQTQFISTSVDIFILRPVYSQSLIMLSPACFQGFHRLPLPGQTPLQELPCMRHAPALPVR